MDIDLGQLIIQSFFAGIGPVASAAWQMMLDNPWLFSIAPGLVLLGYFERRLSRSRRRSF